MLHVRVRLLVSDFLALAIFLSLSSSAFQLSSCFLVTFFGYAIDELNHVFADDPCSGMDRFEARTKLWEDLEKSGLAIKAEPYTLRVPRSQRGGEVGHLTISLAYIFVTQFGS